MKIAIISDTTYRACTPDYEYNLSFYGSETAHAVIAKALSDVGHNDIHWFAPHGSEPIGTFHPLACYNGSYAENEILDEVSIERLTTKYFDDEKFDFILDFSAIARNIEDVRNYYGFKNYGVFRNGYNGYVFPRLRLVDRHYIVPSIQNKNIFEKHGFPDVTAIYYGIPDFYCPGEDPNYINLFSSNGLELGKNYYLYPHRPTAEKGSYHVLELAAAFPEETFVFMVSNNPVAQHKDAIQDLKRIVVENSLPNVKFVELPLTHKHHFYKRELMRHAKAVLSPFNPNIYMEGFGLANAEPVACGTPILISDSESSRELWVDEKDGLILPYDDRMTAFKMAIRHFSSYDFKPTNKFTVSKCVDNYLNFINKTISINSNGNGT
jgi:glycosyltransferase involved in cell wall biosynthesis